jgi:hypothetical protein
MLAEVMGTGSDGHHDEIERTRQRIAEAMSWAAKWMLRVALVGAGVSASLAACSVMTGCAGLTAKGATDAVFSIAEVACIVAHAELPSEAAIADACALSQDLAPVIRTLVAEQKSAIARARVAACR